MITGLGKELRKLRLDLGVTLFEMARATGVSSSLLSSVETGKKPASESLIQALAAAYDEVRRDLDKYNRLADETRREVKIRLDANKSAGAPELALVFARKFDSLTNEQISSLMKVFDRK